MTLFSLYLYIKLCLSVTPSRHFKTFLIIYVSWYLSYVYFYESILQFLHLLAVFLSLICYLIHSLFSSFCNSVNQKFLRHFRSPLPHLYFVLDVAGESFLWIICRCRTDSSWLHPLCLPCYAKVWDALSPCFGRNWALYTVCERTTLPATSTRGPWYLLNVHTDRFSLTQKDMGQKSQLDSSAASGIPFLM